MVGGNCNKFVVYDRHGNYQSGNVGCEYPIQHTFTAYMAEYLDRYFSGTNCKTVCLPYKATLPTGMRAYKLTHKNTIGRESFMFESVSGNQLAANTPYLIRIVDGSGSKQFGTDHNVSVLVTPPVIETQAADGSGFYFGGTTTNIDNATASGLKTYNLVNNEWRPIRTDTPSGYVHSFRAYVRTDGPAPAKGFAIVIDDESDTTGIDAAAELTEEDLRSGKHVFYTLDGRRAGTNYDGLKGGEMYVVKGKKFYKF